LLENLKCQITVIKDQTWLAITTKATTAQKSTLSMEKMTGKYGLTGLKQL